MFEPKKTKLTKRMEYDSDFCFNLLPLCPIVLSCSAVVSLNAKPFFKDIKNKNDRHTGIKKRGMVVGWFSIEYDVNLNFIVKQKASQ